MIPLQYYLVLGAILFFIGLLGALTRRHIVIVLLSIEIMLNAANLNFIAFWRFNPWSDPQHGPLFVLFAMAIAAAELAVGLALVIAVYRFRRTVDVEQFREPGPAKK